MKSTLKDTVGWRECVQGRTNRMRSLPQSWGAEHSAEGVAAAHGRAGAFALLPRLQQVHVCWASRHPPGRCAVARRGRWGVGILFISRTARKLGYAVYVNVGDYTSWETT